MTCQENKLITLMAHVASESKLRSVVGHTCIHAKEDCAAIGRVVVFTAPVAHIFSAGIRCRHCSWQFRLDSLLKIVFLEELLYFTVMSPLCQCTSQITFIFRCACMKVFTYRCIKSDSLIYNTINKTRITLNPLLSPPYHSGKFRVSVIVVVYV